MESHNPGLLAPEPKGIEIVPTQSLPLAVRLLKFLGLSSNKKRKVDDIESPSSPLEQQSTRKINASIQTTPQVILETIHVKTMRIPYDLTDIRKCDLIFEAIDPNTIIITPADSKQEKTDETVGLYEAEAIDAIKIADKVQIRAHSFVLKSLSQLVATQAAFPTDQKIPLYKFKIPVKNKDNLLQLIKLAYTFDHSEIDKLQLDENFIEIIHLSSFLQMDELTKVLLIHFEQLLKTSTVIDFIKNHNILLSYIALMSNSSASTGLEQAKDIFLDHIKKIPPSAYEDPSVFTLDKELFSQILSIANLSQYFKLKLIKRYSENPFEEKIDTCQLKLSLIQTSIKLGEIIPDSTYSIAYGTLVTKMNITNEEVIDTIKSLIQQYICQPLVSPTYDAWPFGDTQLNVNIYFQKMIFDVKIFLEPSKYKAPTVSKESKGIKNYSFDSPPIECPVDQRTIVFNIKTGIAEKYYDHCDPKGEMHNKTKCTLSFFISPDPSNFPFSTYITGHLSASLIPATAKLKKHRFANGRISFFKSLEGATLMYGTEDLPLTEDITHVDSNRSQFAWVHAEVSELKLQRM